MLDPTSPSSETEIVTRPDPGLGRGKWEASPRLIVSAGVVLLVAFLAFLLWKARRARAVSRRPSSTFTSGTAASRDVSPEKTPR